ncbi:MAG: carotenoid biosynthesis protein, partial [Bacteroidetes bacterium]|nr:carotenoid biosynthesis protein [Bacteroidota bacterium]
YHYTDKLGFKLLYVPLIIMPAYVSTGYLAWMIAHILLNTYEKKLEGRNIFMVPFIASFIMVMWDLAMDPYISTVSKNWTWEEGGCYYGVPFVNYMGWFLCVFTIYILFALYQNRYGEKPKSPAVVNTKSFWIHCSIMYALLQLFLVFKTAFGSDGSITALDGHVWSMSDLYSGTLLVSIFTMIFVSVLAINHVLARNNSE